MYVCEVFKGLRLVEEGDYSLEDGVHPATGRDLENAVYLDCSEAARRGYRTQEFVGSAN